MTHEWVAHCHSCMDAHADWAIGDIWQCLRCYFKIPAEHVWWWCPLTQKPIETRTNTQEYVQAALF